MIIQLTTFDGDELLLKIEQIRNLFGRNIF